MHDPNHDRSAGSAFGPLIVSRTAIGEFVVHPAARLPNRLDPRFATVAEADAYIERGGAAAAGLAVERPGEPAVSRDGPAEPEIEILAALVQADGTVLVTGFVGGYTMRATCGGGTVNVHMEDLEIVGLAPGSERADRLIERWTRHLFERGYAEHVSGGRSGEAGPVR